MGYYRGEGKRSTFGIGAFLVGVRSGDTFLSVTKVGTGVSDEQWKTLAKNFNAYKVPVHPKEYPEVSAMLEPDVWLKPALVVEIAGDDLTKSPSHGAGYAVRFPRLVRERHDKNPAQVTTVTELTQMYQNQLGATVHTK
jgi:DNA ligase-1